MMVRHTSRTLSLLLGVAVCCVATLQPATAASRAERCASIKMRLAGSTVRTILASCHARAVLRDPAQWLLFKCGPMGEGCHGHADQLQVLARGRVTLLDPGTPTYNGDDALRDASTATAAHNPVTVDGRSQAERAARFRWGTRTDGAGLALAEGGVRGQVRYGDVAHARRARWDGRALVLHDDVACPGEHEVTASLLAPGPLRIEHDGWERVREEPATWSPVYADVRPAVRTVLRARMRDRFRGRIAIHG